MRLLRFLFGRAAEVTAPPEDMPLEPITSFAALARPSRPSDTRKMVIAPTRSAAFAGEPVVARPAPEEQEYWIDYSKPGEAPRRRRIVFLLASPGNMITGIDLDQRRIRTYRLDRIGAVTNPRTNIALPAEDFFAANPVVRVQDWTFGDWPQNVANKMMQRMICQISLMVLLTQAGAGMTPRALDAIMDYIQRDNRFAVRADSIPTGDKYQVWPILRNRVLSLKPRRDHLLAYVKTLNENWDNARRFTVLNDAVTAICHIDGGPTDAQRRLAMEVDAAGK